MVILAPGSNYLEDTRQENEVYKFIRNNKLFEKMNMSVEWNQHETQQFMGMDFTGYPIEGGKIICDGKLQGNKYINHPTNTFCMELGYEKYGQHYDGWFLEWLDKRKLTTDYGLFSVYTYKDLIKLTYDDRPWERFWASDIRAIEVIITPTQKISDYAKQYGYDYDVFNRLLAEIRRLDINGPIPWESLPNFTPIADTHFYYSKDTPEKPILWIIPKRKYVEWSIRYGYYEMEGEGILVEKPGKYSKPIPASKPPIVQQQQALTKWFL